MSVYGPNYKDMLDVRLGRGEMDFTIGRDYKKHCFVAEVDEGERIFYSDLIVPYMAYCDKCEVFLPKSFECIHDDEYSNPEGYGRGKYLDKINGFHIHPDNPDYTSVDGVIFSKDMETLIAFPAGKDISSYKIPKGVEYIGDKAFDDSANLKYIILPSTLKEIGRKSFEGCSSLEEILINPDNPYYTSIDGVLFSKDMKTLSFIVGKDIKEYTIPEGVEKIEPQAFDRCNLEKIVLPSTLKEIGENWFGENAFEGCPRLKEIVVPPHLEEWAKKEFGNEVKINISEKDISDTVDKIKECIDTGADVIAEVSEFSLRDSQVREAIAEYVTQDKESIEYKELMSIEDNYDFYTCARFCAMCNQEIEKVDDRDSDSKELENIDLDD